MRSKPIRTWPVRVLTMAALLLFLPACGKNWKPNGPPPKAEPPRVDCAQPIGDRAIAPTPISWDPVAVADYIAYLLGIVRAERGRVDAGNDCLKQYRERGIIQ